MKGFSVDGVEYGLEEAWVDEIFDDAVEAAGISIPADPVKNRAFEGLFIEPFGEGFDEAIGTIAFHEEGDAFA